MTKTEKAVVRAAMRWYRAIDPNAMLIYISHIKDVLHERALYRTCARHAKCKGRK